MACAFELPSATAVLTTTYVTRDRIPILVVWRELGDDGDLWQFHCGNGDYDPSKLQLVRLDEIVGLDPTVIDLAHLAVGQSARRAGVDQPWTIVTEH
jgi:hypothetical protein